jgi:DNA-binding transcriptional MerR regulator
LVYDVPEVRSMLIKDVCAAAKLTKKAVEYYTEQGLVRPAVLCNGYRDFSAEDVETLKKTAVLRRLGLGIEDIRSALADKDGETLRDLSVRGGLRLKREAAKQEILGRLGAERDWDMAGSSIESAGASLNIAERLLDAFPGYYGRFLSLHFAQFLDMPIETDEQREAYDTIVRFLDNAPAMKFPDDVIAFLAEYASGISARDIADISGKTRQSLEDPDRFLSENKNTLERYAALLRSKEYKRSPASKLKALLLEFNTASGYYDVFIPAMKKLSPSYAEYHKQLEAANEKLERYYTDRGPGGSG